MLNLNQILRKIRGYGRFSAVYGMMLVRLKSFFDDIVPRLVEKSIHIERFYEEWSRSHLYEIVDGKVHLSGDDGIWYGI